MVMNRSLLFNVSLTIEILTGFALLIAPALVIELLLGEGLNFIGVAVARVLGIGLLSLGVSAWESSQQQIQFTSRMGVFTYNIGVAILLCMFGVQGEFTGVLLWPAAVLHGIIGMAMFRVISFSASKNSH